MIKRFKKWLDSWKPCNKELKGYNCKHGTYVKGGKWYRECDGEPV
jgi:hypothetical protein